MTDTASFVRKRWNELMNPSVQTSQIPPTIKPNEALRSPPSSPSSPSVYVYKYLPCLFYYAVLLGAQVGLRTQRLSLVGSTCAWLHSFKETFWEDLSGHLMRETGLVYALWLWMDAYDL
jgi:hypothetical protein